MRNLVVVLGDQLNVESSAFDSFERDRDAVLMMEVDEEAQYVSQHKQRLALFFSAMRHFRQVLEKRRRVVHYVSLEDPENTGTIPTELSRWAALLRPERIIVVEPGDYRVASAIRSAARAASLPLDIRTDRHFLCTREGFEHYASGRKSLLMEGFYRDMRRRHDVLMDGSKPLGGRWNFDTENRKPFGARGPGRIRRPRGFRPDGLTRNVIAMVERKFAKSPGSLEAFDYPVTPEHAHAALKDFIKHRLPLFGQYQDAMAVGEPYLYHSRLSSVLNMHLLDPRSAIQEALQAGEADHAPPNAVEGFIRQILGWREFVRGVYWWKMPDYADLNVLEGELPMPAFMWSADTDMRCIQQSVHQLIEHAYAHHIQRLMVLGLFTLLLGVNPYAVHRWHMSMYIDAIDWVSLPNVLGMSQYADGGIVATKPYCASGNYINRMSDYCTGCRYSPKKSVGDDACPFTTLYWDFLMRHRQRLKGNHRMGFQLKNLDNKSQSEKRAVARSAEKLKTTLTREANLT